MITSPDRKPTTGGHLCILASVRLCVALLVGILPALPILAPSIPFEFEQSYTFSGFPRNDGPLDGWLREQTNVSGVKVVRPDAGTLEVRMIRRGVGADAIHPPLGEFGYKGMRQGTFSSSMHYSSILGEPFFALVLLLSAQFGFLVMGTWWFRSARAKGSPLPSIIEGPILPASGYGILLGVFLLTIGFGYDALLGALPLELPDTAGAWRAVTGLPTGPLVIVLAIACVVAPLCEELFFRGAVFGSFRTAHRPLSGGICSALLFAIAHFDLINLIPLLVFGLATAWAYHRTRSLLTTIIAHALNNAVAFIVILW